MNPRRLAFIAVMAVCVLVAPTSALAASIPGYDVSYPNCPQTLPSAGAFWIVGVTHGRAFTYNSCLPTEYAWAATHPTTSNVSLYMNLNAPVGSTAQANISGPCTVSKPAYQLKWCQSYNYGYNAAADAYACASGTPSYGCPSVTSGVKNVNTTWWLDVETTNSWRTDVTLNIAVLSGAVAYLGSVPVASLGFYSTSHQWGVITGETLTFNGTRTFNKYPSWVAGAADAAGAIANCAGLGFTGGGVTLAQYVVTLPDLSRIDADYAC